MYQVFNRTWWKKNDSYPTGREPKIGRKSIMKHVRTEQEARDLCDEYNSTHDAGFLSRKAEYSADY